MSRPTTERGLLDELRSRSEARRIGDDAVVLGPRGETCATVDCQIAGTHFPNDTDPAVVARRLLAVNLSDLAAMGARPLHCLLALAIPPGWQVDRFFDAFLEGCRLRDLELVGGDLSSTRHVTATLTLIGERWPGGSWLERRGAEEGDRIFVGGTLGESALGCELVSRGSRLLDGEVRLPADLELTGLEPEARRSVARHLEPDPQLDLGRRLATLASAATDVSDGLARDLHNLCAESSVGAVVEEEALPLATRHAELALTLGLDPLAATLAGGEDYVLLFTLAPGVAAPDTCTHIGRITRSELLLERRTGEIEPLNDEGWDHFERPTSN